MVRHNRSTEIGTRARAAVVRYLTENGFPDARRATKLTAGDIAGTPQIFWKIEGGGGAPSASDHDVARWWAAAALGRDDAGADAAVLVIRRRSYSAYRAGFWRAVMDVPTFLRFAGADEVSIAAYLLNEAPNFIVSMRLSEAVHTLRWAGYGTPLPGCEAQIP
jgi:hypothetical protein